MKSIVDTKSEADLRSLIRGRFAKFDREQVRTKGRRYPQELRDLVRQGIVAGISIAEIMRLSGMSKSAVAFARGSKCAEADSSLAKKVLPARRLEVVGTGIGSSPEIVARLPSGVTLEFAANASLTPELVAILAALEAPYAASR